MQGNDFALQNGVTWCDRTRISTVQLLLLAIRTSDSPVAVGDARIQETDGVNHAEFMIGVIDGFVGSATVC